MFVDWLVCFVCETVLFGFALIVLVFFLFWSAVGCFGLRVC